MIKKITQKAKLEKERLQKIRKKLHGILNEHQCFLEAQESQECWICGKPYVNGEFINAYKPAKKPVVSEQEKIIASLVTCSCEKDADGECASCKDMCSKIMNSFVTLIINSYDDVNALKETLKIRPCIGCQRQYLDWVAANALRSIIDQLRWKKKLDLTDGLIQMVFPYIIKLMNEFGVKEVPLTLKAWMDLNGKPDVP